jgi:hypothetical protein
MKFVVEKQNNGLLITRDTIKMKVLKVTTLLRILWQGFKASNG